MSEVIHNNPEDYHKGQVERIDAVEALNLAKYQQREAREAMKARLLNWGAWFRIGNDSRRDTAQITSSTLGNLMDTAVPQEPRRYSVDEEDAQAVHDQITTMKESKHIQYNLLMMKYARRGLDGKAKIETLYDRETKLVDEVPFTEADIIKALKMSRANMFRVLDAAIDNLILSGI